MAGTKQRILAALGLLVFLGSLVVLGAPQASAASSGPLVYGVNPYDNVAQPVTYRGYSFNGLVAFNPATGSLAGGSVITVAGGAITDAGDVLGATGLARDPMTSTDYVILKMSNDADPQNPTTYKRLLATIDLTNGQATTLGDTGHNIAAITFAPDGTLYAVSGNGDDLGTSVYILSKTDGQASHVVTLPADDGDGEAIAYNPADDHIYRASGNGPTDSQVFQKIGPMATDPTHIDDVGYTGTAPFEIAGLAYDSTASAFLAQDIDGVIWSITAAGATTELSTMDSNDLKGFIITRPTTPVAVDDSVTLSKNADTTDLDVLANDIDGSVTPVGTITNFTPPSNGTVEIGNLGGSVRYKPNTGYCNSSLYDSFTYTLDTGQTATVRVHVPCPTADQTITLRYVPTRHVFKGKLSSDQAVCTGAGHQVDIYKVDAKNGDHTIGTVGTADDGTFKLKHGARGKYYAQTYSENGHPNEFDCSGATSPTIRVR